MTEKLSFVMDFVRAELDLLRDPAVWHGCQLGVILTLAALLVLWFLLLLVRLVRLLGKRKCGTVSFEGENGSCIITAAAVSDAVGDVLRACPGLEFAACRLYRRRGTMFVQIDCRWVSRNGALAEAVADARGKVLSLLHEKLGLTQLELVNFKVKAVVPDPEEP